MNREAGEGEDENVCANCGVAGIDNIKLKKCGACGLVRYCCVACQKEHRPEHKKECKKRAAELHDENLFKQPESSDLGDCPLCFLPLSLDPKKSSLYSCCSKVICKGCVYANMKSNRGDSCPFCRTPVSDKENHRRIMKRIEANDPVAMTHMARKCYDEGDYDTAFEYWNKAAELGDLIAHYQLGVIYREGEGVEKDEEKAVYHWEKAAVGGDPDARHNLGVMEERNGNMNRAVKHWIIAANQGYDKSMKALWEAFKHGIITKDDLEAAIRAHEAAVDATKSPQREAAERAEQQKIQSRR